MAKLFSQEGAFFRIGTLVFDFMLVSFTWLVTSGLLVYFLLGYLATDFAAGWGGIAVLVVCILLLGPSTTAGIYVMSKRRRGVETYMLKEYFHSYGMNFGQGVLLSFLVNGATLLIAWLAMNELYNLSAFGWSGIVLLILQLLCVIILIFIGIYAFPMLARFDLKTKDLLRLSFIMSIKHLPTTILCLLMEAVIVLAGIFAMPLLLILPGVWLFLEAALMDKVFVRYMPPEEEDEEEDDLDAPLELDPERQAIIAQMMAQENNSNED